MFCFSILAGPVCKAFCYTLYLKIAKYKNKFWKVHDDVLLLNSGTGKGNEVKTKEILIMYGL